MFSSKVYPDVYFVQLPWIDGVVRKLIPDPKPGQKDWREVNARQWALTKQLRKEHTNEVKHLKACGVTLKQHYATEAEAQAAIAEVLARTGVVMEYCLGTYL